MAGNKKFQIWLPLIFSIVLIVGMVLGYQLNGNSGSKDGIFRNDRGGSLQEALDLIRLKYVDSVNLDSLEGRALEQMMSELDPHSVYLPPVDLKAANEDLAGNFEGIGVEFNLFDDTVTVVFVIPEGPSEKAGLKVGDKIVGVDEHPIIGKQMTTEEIKKYIRGQRGSKAVLKIVRDGKKMDIPVTRGTIPVPSVDASYMIDKTTGYIKLNKFTDNSYEEFMDAMEQLKKQGLQTLVFDIRGNGGGFMNEAVDIADEFLDGEKLVVYTEGVNSRKREYRCKRPGIFETGKVYLLVDELSASASEVLAGALQDWCRATIIGRRTFGKGLVQEQYSLSDGAAIRLTVARYYTPLGRSIQRSYAKGKKIYMDEVYERYNSGEMFSLDSIHVHNTGKRYVTACHDTLYGGDGITPDIFVSADTNSYKSSINALLGSNKLSNYIYSYYRNHRQQIDHYSSATDYAGNFNAEELWKGYSTLTSDSISSAHWSDSDKNFVKLRLKALLARFRWRNTGFYQVINQEDPALKKILR